MTPDIIWFWLPKRNQLNHRLLPEPGDTSSSPSYINRPSPGRKENPDQEDPDPKNPENPETQTQRTQRTHYNPQVNFPFFSLLTFNVRIIHSVCFSAESGRKSCFQSPPACVLTVRSGAAELYQRSWFDLNDRQTAGKPGNVDVLAAGHVTRQAAPVTAEHFCRMLLRVSVLVLLVASVLAHLDQNLLDSQWNEWKLTHRRDYDNQVRTGGERQSLNSRTSVGSGSLSVPLFPKGGGGFWTLESSGLSASLCPLRRMEKPNWNQLWLQLLLPSDWWTQTAPRNPDDAFTEL